jgi:oxygen-dependent protoporphyrinogen oxidase
MRRVDAIIIGGGISGAAALHWLARRGADVLLFERNLTLGGVMRSRRNEHGALVETGPNSIQFNTPFLSEMIDDLGIASAVIQPDAAAANRYIMRDGKLVAAPSGPKSFLRSGLFSASAKLRALREPFIPPAQGEHEESVARFVERRLGREFLDYAINPFVSGIYAGQPERLSIRYGFAKIYDLEQGSGSIIKGAIGLARKRRKARKGGAAGSERRGIFSFVDGLATLPCTIEERWKRMIRLGAAIERVERHGELWCVTHEGESFETPHLIVATEASAAAAIVDPFDRDLASVLRQIEYPPVAVASVLYNRSAIAHPLDGFGVLIPEVERRNLLGVIFTSTLFPNRAPEGMALLTAFIGGSRDPQLALRSREEIEFDVHGELRRTLGISARPIGFDLQVWPHAIPQYNLGYGAILDAIDSAEKRLPGFHLLGNYRGGVSVGDCVRSAREMADEIKV